MLKSPIMQADFSQPCAPDNPRYLRHNGFQDRLLKPLGHRSKIGNPRLLKVFIPYFERLVYDFIFLHFIPFFLAETLTKEQMNR